MKNRRIRLVSMWTIFFLSASISSPQFCPADQDQTVRTIYIEPVKSDSASPAYLAQAIAAMLASRMSEPGRLNIKTGHTDYSTADFVLSGSLTHEGDKEKLALALINKKNEQPVVSVSIGPVRVDELPVRLSEFALRARDASLATVKKDLPKQTGPDQKPVLFDVEADNDTKAFARMHPDRLLTHNVPASEMLGGENGQLFADVAVSAEQKEKLLLVDPSGAMQGNGGTESLKNVLGALPSASDQRPVLVTDQPAKYGVQPPPARQNSWLDWLPWISSSKTVQNRVTTINGDYSELPYKTPAQIATTSEPYTYVTTQKKGYFSRLGDMFASPAIPHDIASNSVKAHDNFSLPKNVAVSSGQGPADIKSATTDGQKNTTVSQVGSDSMTAAPSSDVDTTKQPKQSSGQEPQKSESWLGSLLKPFSSEGERATPTTAPSSKTQEAVGSAKKPDLPQQKPVWQWN